MASSILPEHLKCTKLFNEILKFTKCGQSNFDPDNFDLDAFLQPIIVSIFGSDEEYQAFQGRSGSTICGVESDADEQVYSCFDCRTDATCIMCKNCFENSEHINHNVYSHLTSGGICDCGDEEAWKKFPACANHAARSDDGFIPIPPAFTQFLEEIIHLFAFFIQNSRNAVIAVQLSQNVVITKPNISRQFVNLFKKDPRFFELNFPGMNFIPMLYNDEEHSYDEVTSMLHLVFDSTKEQGHFVAAVVDKRGRSPARDSGVDLATCEKLVTSASESSRSRSKSRNALKIETVPSPVHHIQAVLSKLVDWLTTLVASQPSLQPWLMCLLQLEHLGCDPRQEVTEEDFSSDMVLVDHREQTSLLDYFINVYLACWKEIRGAICKLILAAAFRQPELRRKFAHHFMERYRDVVDATVYDNHSVGDSILALPVQFFTVTTLGLELVLSGNLPMVIDVVECVTNNNGPSTDTAEENTGLQPLKRWEVTSDFGRHHLAMLSEYISHHLSYMLGAVGSCKKENPAAWDMLLRSLTRNNGPNDFSLLETSLYQAWSRFNKVFLRFDLMDKTTRQKLVHVSFEKNFMAGIHLFHFWHRSLHYFHRATTYILGVRRANASIVNYTPDASTLSDLIIQDLWCLIANSFNYYIFVQRYEREVLIAQEAYDPLDARYREGSIHIPFNFSVESEPVSLHCHLFRMILDLVVQNIGLVSDNSAIARQLASSDLTLRRALALNTFKDAFPEEVVAMNEHLRGTTVPVLGCAGFEYALISLAFVGQINANLWRRNGFAVAQLAHIYTFSELQCHLRCSDLLTLQYSAAFGYATQPDVLLHWIAAKFGVLPWLIKFLTATFDNRPNLGSIDVFPRLPSLFDQFLLSLCWIVTERVHHRIVSPETDRLEHILIMELSRSPNLCRTHSQLDHGCRSCGKGFEREWFEARGEAVLAKIATKIRTPEGKVLYQLKPEYLDRHNVFSIDRNVIELTKMTDNVNLRKSQITGVKVQSIPTLPPPLPRLSHAFAPLLEMLRCETMSKMFCHIISKFYLNHAFLRLDSHLEKVLWLMEVAMKEHERYNTSDVEDGQYRFEYVRSALTKDFFFVNCIVSPGPQTREDTYQNTLYACLQRLKQLCREMSTASPASKASLNVSPIVGIAVADSDSDEEPDLMPGLGEDIIAQFLGGEPWHASNETTDQMMHDKVAPTTAQVQLSESLQATIMHVVNHAEDMVQRFAPSFLVDMCQKNQKTSFSCDASNPGDVSKDGNGGESPMDDTQAREAAKLRQRSIAEARRKRMMDSMKKQQQQFLLKHPSESSKHTSTPKSSRMADDDDDPVYLREYTCIICQETTIPNDAQSDSTLCSQTGPIVLSGLIQRSSLLLSPDHIFDSQAPVLCGLESNGRARKIQFETMSKSFVRSASNSICESEEETQSMQKPTCDPLEYFVDDFLTKPPGESSVIGDTERAKLGRPVSRPNCHISGCSHAMHAVCFLQQKSSLRRRSHLDLFGSMERGSPFLCGMCSGYTNLMIPVVNLAPFIQGPLLSPVDKEPPSSPPTRDFVRCFFTAVVNPLVSQSNFMSATFSARATQPVLPADMVKSLREFYTSISHQYASSLGFLGNSQNPEMDALTSIFVCSTLSYTLRCEATKTQHLGLALLDAPNERYVDVLKSFVSAAFARRLLKLDNTTLVDLIQEFRKKLTLSGDPSLQPSGSQESSHYGHDLVTELCMFLETLPCVAFLASLTTDEVILYVRRSVLICLTQQTALAIRAVQLQLAQERRQESRGEAMEVDPSSSNNASFLHHMWNSFGTDLPIPHDLWGRVCPHLMSFLHAAALLVHYLPRCMRPHSSTEPPMALVDPEARLTGDSPAHVAILMQWLGIDGADETFLDAAIAQSAHETSQATDILSLHDVLDFVASKVIKFLSYPLNEEAVALATPRVRLLKPLPFTFSELLSVQTAFRKIHNISQLMYPTLCLVCHSIICSRSFCCLIDGKGGLTQHRQRCFPGGGGGIFLCIKNCRLIVFANKSVVTYSNAPYVDRHGETDTNLRRNGLLHLCEPMFRKLQQAWLSHTLHEIVNRHWTIKDAINNDIDTHNTAGF